MSLRDFIETQRKPTVLTKELLERFFKKVLESKRG